LKKWSLLIALLFLCACSQPTETAVENTPLPPTTAPQPATAVAGALYVNPALNRGPINPLVYGANYGPWSSVPVTALEDFQQSGLTLLRFPGGNWGDDDFVRANHVNMLKTFVDMIDGQVVVSANLREGTPQQAVELMEMVEAAELDVVYWSIGNEPNLFADKLNADHWDTAHYNKQWRIFAEAMKAHDPNIKLVGPDLSQYMANDASNAKDAAGLDWMREFLRANGDLVDNVSFHRYPFGGTPSIAEVRATSPEFDAIIPHLRQVIQEETGRDIPVSVMEVNSNWSHAVGGEATPDSFYNAIWWADSLGRLINQDVEMVAFFTLAHNDGTTLLARDGSRPTYYVYQLYQQFGQEKLHAASGLDMVSIFAAKRDDGALTLMVVNRGDEDVSTPLQIDGEALGDTAVLHRFDSEHQAENMGKVSIQELNLPAQSISLYIIPAP
jgi:hypothetical protein